MLCGLSGVQGLCYLLSEGQHYMKFPTLFEVGLDGQRNIQESACFQPLNHAARETE